MAQSIGLAALRLPPGEPTVEALERVWGRGDAAMPLPHDLPTVSLRSVLDELRPTTVLDADGERRWDRRAPALRDDTALVVGTSGSSGRPKGVELSHATLAAAARASSDRLGRHADDRWLCCLPLHHVAGVAVLTRSRLLGRAPVVHARFDPAAVAAADATLVALVPAMLVRLLDAGVEVGRFRAVLLGGAAPPPGLLRRAEAAGARVVTSYGLTETAGGCVYDGVPLDGVEVRVEPDRRIAIRGTTLFSGYRLRPDLTARALRDGWLRTADLGTWERGRLRVLGRADATIVSGGVNVPPAAVEAVLTEHPGVAEVAASGRADPRWGQRVVAVIVPVDPARPPTLADLRDFVTARAPAAHAPREVVVVERVPRTPLGKVDRGALSDVLGEPPGVDAAAAG